jgi:wyosine [tRNA(Phe)-imidazoG37] synthetase (radical SAM superfamily)
MNDLSIALEAHKNGQFHTALQSYRLFLSSYPDDPVALYGISIILLSQGDLTGYEAATRAIFTKKISSLDRSQAAESIISSLLHTRQQDLAYIFLQGCLAEAIHLPHLEAFQKATTIPPHLEPSAFDHQLQKNLSRYHPMESSRYVYAIDIVGGCNLRCPTCPVSQQSMPKGLMQLTLFKNILDKIKAESKDKHPDIWLFNWTEPFLHPELDLFVKAVKQAGLSSFISTNLNSGHRLEAVIAENPDQLKVSLSSFKQNIYGQTHVRGNIERVKANLVKLAKLIEKYQATTQVFIGHHLYRNTIEEQTEIAEFSHQLHFNYAPSNAILAPLETVMKLMTTKKVPELNGLYEQFLQDPIEIARTNSLKRSGNKDCELRFNMTTLQYDGQVNLCCGTTQKIAATPTYFMEKSFEELESLKYNNPFCKKCISLNLHLTIPDQ